MKTNTIKRASVRHYSDNEQTTAVATPREQLGNETGKPKRYRESFTIGEVLVKYQELRAHAEKLAEALKHLMAITRNSDALQLRQANKALAAWKEAKQ